MMRKYLVEGDLISAEVQKIYEDGSLSLHTRSFIYGKVHYEIISLHSFRARFQRPYFILFS